MTGSAGRRTGALDVRPAGAADRPWIAALLGERWGATVVASRGRLHDALELPAMVAASGGEPLGLATYLHDGSETELVTLDALASGAGVGTALLSAVAGAAADAGSERLVLVTTNDNLDALRFYQRRGLRLRALRPGAVDDARRAKPAIPLVGRYGIAIRDELELVLDLARAGAAVPPPPGRPAD